jgi:hypothetical protein
MKLALALLALSLPTGCVSLANQERIKNVEACVLRMIVRDVPADIAMEICERMYENIHIKSKEAKKE